MPLFKRKKQEVEVVDNRTELEKKFEETGKNVGKKAGELVQKSVDKIQGVKQILKDKGTMDKVKNVQTKVDQTVESGVDTVAKKASKVLKKEKKNTIKTEQTEDFYE